ncbi:MAG: ATP-dependent zinc metalloprotease FtsH [Anaerolineae bacterium]|nr:ATP-dependent zinc metalloprotease FtsH [Anaerolineae bacterium]
MKRKPTNGGTPVSKWFKSGTIYLLLLAAFLIILFRASTSVSARTQRVDLSTLANDVKAGKVTAIQVNQDGVNLRITRNDQSGEFSSNKEATSGITEVLTSFGVTPDQLDKVKIEVVGPGFWSNWGNILASLLPILLFGGFIFFMFRQAQGGTNQAMSFGKSRARMFSGDKPTVTFADVAGVDEAKHELAEVVEFLKEPEKFISLGARIPKGVLMVGPPGCGKTLLAKAVAGEAGAPFFSISGSEFVEMFVGVGASRVRDLFEQAKRHSPCIIFVDEIDAVGRHRGAGLGGSHDEREQTLNQILVEMDGFDSDTHIIIIAATNRPDILDPALMRPGRFDRRVIIDRPDVAGRKHMFKIHTRGKPLAPDVDLEICAKITPGFSGADIENLVNEAAILAARRNAKAISMKDMQDSMEKVVMGPERKSRVISPVEKRIVAYHEAGHALVGHLLPNCDPIHKVTIVPRGMAGGFVMPLPDSDRQFRNVAKFKDDLAFTLGGRVAEEIVFGDVTTGASSDLEKVTKLARAMVTQYGMSEKLGPITFGEKEEMVFLGREIGEQRNYSEAVAEEIDAEVRMLVTEAYERARGVVVDNRPKLDLIAQKLMDVETLDAADFRALFAATETNGAVSAPSANGASHSDSTGPADSNGDHGSVNGPSPI